MKTQYSAPVTAQFVYDGLGRRVEKIINGVSTKYVYDGWDIVQEIEDSQVKWNYLRSLNIDEPLARIGFDGTKEFYHADMLGSVTAITDEDGNVKTQYRYSPFGESTLVGESSDNPFRYTAREYDATGLMNYRHRYYNPKIGRFISEDPIGLAGGINLYSYVHNRPLRFRDPYGLYTFQQFLNDTSNYSMIAATATFLIGAEPATLVFSGVSAGAMALKITLYSDDPISETIRESIKMVLPVKQPWSMFTDQAVDKLADKAIENVKKRCE